MSTEYESSMIVGLSMSYKDFEEMVKKSEVVMNIIGEDFFIENEGYNAMNLETIAESIGLEHSYNEDYIEAVTIGKKVNSPATLQEVSEAFNMAKEILLNKFYVNEENIKLQSCLYYY